MHVVRPSQDRQFVQRSSLAFCPRSCGLFSSWPAHRSGSGCRGRGPPRKKKLQKKRQGVARAQIDEPTPISFALASALCRQAARQVPSLTSLLLSTTSATPFLLQFVFLDWLTRTQSVRAPPSLNPPLGVFLLFAHHTPTDSFQTLSTVEGA